VRRFYSINWRDGVMGASFLAAPDSKNTQPNCSAFFETCSPYVY
jgi:hypothetical protein